MQFKTSNRKAVTLIELLVTLAIIAILVTIAMPAYRDYLRQARRTDAITALQTAKTQLEEYYTDNGEYPATGWSEINATSENNYYNITYTQVDTESYTLRATAIAGTSQAADSEDSVDCSTISTTSRINHTLPLECK